MHNFLKLFIALATFFTVTIQTGAQESADETVKTVVKLPNPLDGRGGLPLPENLRDIKNLSIDFWLRHRRTNQALYSYINEAAAFHAYNYICKRHNLNVKMGPITDEAIYNLQAVIPAHYDEPEYFLLDKLTKDEQIVFLDDMGSDIYAFEVGSRVALQNARIIASGKTKKSYCADVKMKNYRSYVLLRAVARRELKARANDVREKLVRKKTAIQE